MYDLLTIIISEYFEQEQVRQATVTVTTAINFESRRRLNAFAANERTSLSGVVRSWLLEAVKTGRLPPGDDKISVRGAPLAIRVPIDVRDQLRDAAVRRGTNVSLMVAAVIAANMEFL